MESSNALKKKESGGIRPWLFLLPTILILGYWVFKPFVQTIIYAFYDWNMLPGTYPEFVGLRNFRQLFLNPEFGQAMKNTIFYIIALIPFSVIFPLIISALLQNVSERSQRVYRILIFVPMIMPPVVNAIVFQWLFNQTNGLINYVLVGLGILEKGMNFFTHPVWARRIISLITGWKMFAYASIMYSGAIGGINQEYYEAAKLDGAEGVRQFFDITVPLLSPTIMLMLMMSVLFASQWTFNYIDLLTQGGPFGNTTNFYYLIYKNAFQNSNIGLSACSSLVFLAIFGTLSVILQIISRKITFYDN